MSVYALTSKVDRVKCVLDDTGMSLVKNALIAAKVGHPRVLSRFRARGSVVGELLGRRLGSALGYWLSGVKPGITTVGYQHLLTRSEWLVIMAFAAFNAKHAPYEVK